MKHVKSPRWRQSTPQDQFEVIVNSMTGHMSNFREGIITADKLANHLEAHTEELKSLVHFVANPKEW